MKRIAILNLIGIFLLNQKTVSAQEDMLEEIVVTASRESQTFQEIVTDIILRASDYALVLLVGLTVLVFMYGLMKYMFKGQGSDTARTEGRKLMFWGIIGLFVITSVWALVAILANTFGHTNTAIPQFRESFESERAPYGRDVTGEPVTETGDKINKFQSRLVERAQRNAQAVRNYFNQMLGRAGN